MDQVRPPLALAALLVASACGSNAAAPPDSALDHHADAPASDALPDNVTVQVTEDLGPVANAIVQFNDVAGTRTFTARTDASGRVHAAIGADTIVTVSRGDLFQVDLPDMVTVVGVQPGDEVTMRWPIGGATIGSMSLVVPPSPDAFSYDAVGTCSGLVSGAGSTLSVPVYPQCVGHGDVLVEAHAAAGVAYLAGTIDYQKDGHATLTGTWQPLPAVALHYSGLDPQRLDRIEGARIAPRYRPILVDPEPVAGPTLTEGAELLPDDQASFHTRIFAKDGREQAIAEPAAQLTDYTLDVAVHALPWLDPPAFDLARGTFVVGTSAGVAADFAELDAFITPQAHPDQHFHWRVFVPRVEDTTLPRLVGDLASRMPATGDHVDVALRIYDTGGVDAYAAAHARIVDVARGLDRGETRQAFRSSSTGPHLDWQ